VDLFVYVSKLDEQGNPLPARVLGFPSPGARGLLRVSYRELDEARSTPSKPSFTHRREQFLKPKEIVPVEIGIWAAPWVCFGIKASNFASWCKGMPLGGWRISSWQPWYAEQEIYTAVVLQWKSDSQLWAKMRHLLPRKV
jgi:hypothetical protein